MVIVLLSVSERSSDSTIHPKSVMAKTPKNSHTQNSNDCMFIGTYSTADTIMTAAMTDKIAMFLASFAFII